MSIQLEMEETKEDRAFCEAVQKGQNEIKAGLGVPAEEVKVALLNWRSRSKKFFSMVRKAE